jgi:hypothetical protein
MSLQLHFDRIAASSQWYVFISYAVFITSRLPSTSEVEPTPLKRSLNLKAHAVMQGRGKVVINGA